MNKIYIVSAFLIGKSVLAVCPVAELNQATENKLAAMTRLCETRKLINQSGRELAQSWIRKFKICAEEVIGEGIHRLSMDEFLTQTLELGRSKEGGVNCLGLEQTKRRHNDSFEWAYFMNVLEVSLYDMRWEGVAEGLSQEFAEDCWSEVANSQRRIEQEERYLNSPFACTTP